jgi:hypothetical protein
MSESDGAAARVYVFNSEAKDLRVGLDDGGKGLVELPYCDVGLGKTGLLDELLNNRGRSNWEVDGV